MTTFDLIANIFCATVLPILIVINYRDRHAPKTQMSSYVWANHPTLGKIGLIFLSLLALLCAVDLAGYYGLLQADVVKTAQSVFGIPLLVLSLTLIVLTVRAVYLARARG